MAYLHHITDPDLAALQDAAEDTAAPVRGQGGSQPLAGIVHQLAGAGLANHLEQRRADAKRLAAAFLEVEPFQHQVGAPGAGVQVLAHLATDVIPAVLVQDRHLAAPATGVVAAKTLASHRRCRGDLLHRHAASGTQVDPGYFRHRRGGDDNPGEPGKTA